MWGLPCDTHCELLPVLCNDLSVFSQLTAGYWQNGAAVRLVGWLVSRVCRVSVSMSVRARFAHISGTGRPINFVFGVRQRAARPENVCRA